MNSPNALADALHADALDSGGRPGAADDRRRRDRAGAGAGSAEVDRRQEGGDFGAILTGNATRAVPALNYVPSHERQKSPFTARYGAIEFNLDAGWSSAVDALNHTSARLLRRRDYLQVLRRVEG